MSRSSAYDLQIRQQPKEALVTQEGKEKNRKPVDPPPIIELKVDRRYDPSMQYLQSPYYFMCCSLVGDSSDPEDAQDPPSKTLAGQMVSSLHRLKNVNNEDGGFFVFGDLSIRKAGRHRLMFSLFEMVKHSNEVTFLKSVLTQPFRVVQSKDWHGLDESTYLSRAFSDQGVRLRLRKEPRAITGSHGSLKRNYTYSPPLTSDTTTRPTTQRADSYAQEESYTYGPPTIKRQKSDNGYSNPHIFPPTTMDMTRYPNYDQRQQMYKTMPTLYTQSSSMSMSYPMSASAFPSQSTSHWANQISQGSLSANSGPGSGYSFSSAPSTYTTSYAYPTLTRPANAFGNRNEGAQQPPVPSNQQYRNPNEGYGAASGLVTPTSVQDTSGLAPGQGSNYLTSAVESKAVPGSHNAPQAQTHPHQYHQHLSSPLTHYGTDPSLNGSQNYATSLSSPALASHYSQPQEATVPRTQQVYGEPGREMTAYPASGTMSHASIPAMTLNTDLTGPYYGHQYSEVGDSGLEQSAYPTPGGTKSWAS